MTKPLESISPDWNVPNHVHALVTLRSGGVSRGTYQGLNLANHVGDFAVDVLKNRQCLVEQFKLPSEPCWLEQTHSTDVIELSSLHSNRLNRKAINGDAVWTKCSNLVCAVLTADCLPVFFYHTTENTVAVSHAGWRGLADGIIEKTVASMTSIPEQLQVWLGPAIGFEQFEVGAEVKNIFCQHDPQAEQCFKQSNHNSDNVHYMADIYRLAKRRLYNVGVTSISGGNYCTVSDVQRFFSYRRDGKTGRMANLIWLSE